MSHLARRLTADTEPDQLVVLPAGPVNEQACTAFQVSTHRCRWLLCSRHIHQGPAGMSVGDAIPHHALFPLPGPETRPLICGNVEGSVGQTIRQRYLYPCSDRSPLDASVGAERLEQ